MSTVKLQIGPVDAGRALTLEEFHEADWQEGYLYELARGVLEVTIVPGDDHAQIIHNLHEGFSEFGRRNPYVILRIGHGSDIRYVIPQLESDRHPDLALVFRETPRDPQGRRQALLAVEVVSPGKRARKRDYQDKREEYLSLGLAEYWIVDPRPRQVTLLTREDGPAGATWAETVIFAEGTITSNLLPGFAFPVASLWTDADTDQDGPVDL